MQRTGLLFVIGCVALAHATRSHVNTELDLAQSDYTASDLGAPDFAAIDAAVATASSNKTQEKFISKEDRKHMNKVNKLWDRKHEKWIADFRAFGEQWPQPSEAWDVQKCYSHGDSDVMRTVLKKASTTTSPAGYFWFAKSLLAGLVIVGSPQMTDTNKELLLRKVGTVKRGECCGGTAKWINVDQTVDRDSDDYGYHGVNAKLQCTGADLGEPCRLRNLFGMLFSSSSCREGLKCTKLEGGDEDSGECKPP